jgi:hypothetical protein
MRDADPDFRIVATDDLMKGLTENTLRVAESDERDLVQAVLRLLADVNGEVQNRAVQWYAFIITRRIPRVFFIPCAAFWGLQCILD